MRMFEWKGDAPQSITFRCRACHENIKMYVDKLKPACPLCGEKVLIDMLQLRDILQQREAWQKAQQESSDEPTVEHAVPMIPKEEDKRSDKSYVLEALRWLTIGTVAIGLMFGMFRFLVFIAGR